MGKAMMAHALFCAAQQRIDKGLYASMDDFMSDMNIIFENAKFYNKGSSQIHKDAVALQVRPRCPHALLMTMFFCTETAESAGQAAC